MQRDDSPRTARAFAPGSIGNIGPGLDILGCAVTGAGDAVVATRVATPGVRVDDPGHPDLPRDPTLHASAIAAAEVLRRWGQTRGQTRGQTGGQIRGQTSSLTPSLTPSLAPDFGVALTVEKGLPLAGGQGGSSASAVAGALAVNALLDSPLDFDELLAAALVAEERVAGRHLDNLAPALYGGIVLVRSIDPIDVVRLPVLPQLRVVLVHPAQQLRTAESRAVLPRTLDRAVAFGQAANVAAMVAALGSGDLALLGRALDDRIAEPARAPLLPGFAAAKTAALEAGAIGCSISGAGPTAFAFAADEMSANRIALVMRDAYAASGLAATTRVERIDERGARV